MRISNINEDVLSHWVHVRVAANNDGHVAPSGLRAIIRAPVSLWEWTDWQTPIVCQTGADSGRIHSWTEIHNNNRTYVNCTQLKRLLPAVFIPVSSDKPVETLRGRLPHRENSYPQRALARVRTRIVGRIGQQYGLVSVFKFSLLLLHSAGVPRRVLNSYDLGVLIVGELSMRQHVTRLAQTCFFHLRRLRSLRRQLGRDVMARLVSALVLSRLDYCNAVLTGLSASIH